MSRRGYTLIELLIALGITMLIAATVFYLYTNVLRGMRRAEVELQSLAAYRTAVDTLERNLKYTVVKSGYVPADPPRFKPLSDGLFRLQWPGRWNHLAGYAEGKYQDGKCRYLGFYTSADGVHVDRVEYYFNPPEPSALCANGVDDDHDDDPSDTANPIHLMRDDRGRLMVRRVRDSQITYAQYHNQAPAGADGIEAPGFPVFCAPHLTGAQDSDCDRGETIAEGFSDIYFEFIYTSPRADGTLEFRAASRWPATTDASDTSRDESGQVWPDSRADGRQPRALSFLALPLAVRVTFEFSTGAQARRYSHTLLLPQSQWHEFLSR